MDLRELIKKYSQPGPRYTSYPTAPEWSAENKGEVYEKSLKNLSESEIALYVHLPFCESLCYYCGCNVKITKNKGSSLSYIESVLNEAGKVADTLDNRKSIIHMSWGGGTPTFSSVEELTQLFTGLQKHFDISKTAEISIEVDPRVTTDAQLKRLRELGFNRISLGVQDFEPQVQKAIHRIQPEAMTLKILERSRELGFEGINFDLMYGLPLQTVKSFANTVENVIRMRPDRIALYNYARLPAMIPHQKILEKYEMPTADDRVEIFSLAYEMFLENGYRAIGMDHFALESDELYQSISKGSLYRNFMGYTVQKSPSMIGLGASAIGELPTSFFQNVREPGAYQELVGGIKWAVMRGCLLTEEDKIRKKIIQSIFCRFKVSYEDFSSEFGIDFKEKFGEEINSLETFFQEGILEKQGAGFSVTSLGRLFVRNVAMAFDEYLKKPSKVQYSTTV